MNPNSSRTSKGEIFKSMMKRPETSKLIRQALASPIGSTPRAKAQKIFSIMSKLNSSNDGMGGPGMTYERMAMGGGQPLAPEMDPVHIPTEGSKGMVIFHKIPTPKITYGNLASKFKPRAGSFDGSGGPGDLSSLSIGSAGGVQPSGFNLGSFSLPTSPGTNPSSLITGAPSSYTGLGSANTNFPRLTSMFSTPFATSQDYSKLSIPSGPTGAPPAGVSSAGQAASTMAISPTGQFAPQAPVWDPVSGSFSTGAPAAPATTGAPATTTTAHPDVSTAAPAAGATTGTTTTPANQAATNVAAILKVPTTTPLVNISTSSLAAAIAQNEGFTTGTSTIAINNNNPGNLKFVGQPGAVQGSPSSDGGYFAKFLTVNDGWTALKNDLDAKVTSGKFSTIADLMAVYSPDGSTGTGVTPTTPTSKYTGLSATAQGAVNQNTGAAMFSYNQMAMPSDPFTGGKTLAQMEQANEKSIWDKYNVGGLQTKEDSLLTTGDALSTARNQYLLQTNAAINTFMDNAVKTTDLSNPSNIADLNGQLGYLYSLRGSQNNSYLSYLSNAIDQNQTELSNVHTMYSTALTAYENDLKNADTVTETMYKGYSQALADMYTAVDAAPLKQIQIDAYKQQYLDAHTTAVSDALKAAAQSDYLAMYPKFKDQIYDSSGFAMNIDLVQKLAEFAAGSPGIDTGIILQIYNNTVNNALKAPSGSKDGNGQPISKTKIATEALTNYAKLAGEGVKEKNMGMVSNAIGYGSEVASTYASTLGGEWGMDPAVAGKVRNLISSLAATGWFGGSKATPSKTDFINSAKSQGLDTGMANAIYDEFASYMSTPGAKAADYVDSRLNNTHSQTGRVPWTDQELLSKAAGVYTNSLLSQSLSLSGIQLNADGSITLTSTGSTTSV